MNEITIMLRSVLLAQLQLELLETKQTMDAETRELAKQLFIYSGMDGISAIKHAKQMIQLLNNK